MVEGRTYTARVELHLSRWIRDGCGGIDQERWPGGLARIARGRRLECSWVFGRGEAEFRLGEAYVLDEDPSGHWSEVDARGQLVLPGVG